MRIAHVLAPGAVGGLESVVRALAAGQRARGHEITAALVVDQGDRPHPLVAPLEAGGVRVVTLAMPGRAYLAERRALRRLFAEVRPMVVHTHGYRPDVLARGPAREAGAATVTTVHGFTGGGWRNRVYEWLQTRAFRRFDAVVAVSRPLVTHLTARGVSPSRVHLIANAWRDEGGRLGRAAARAALGLPVEASVLGWVGRLSAEKGPDLFLDAIARLANRSVIACILGDGRERSALQAQAQRLGVDGNVRWAGTVPDAARLYAAFDGFVLSSRTEGTPIVLFEAMAAGVPIVATKVGGVPDVVTPAEAALVPPGDPAALAAAMAELLDAPAAALARADCARRRLAGFGADAWLDAYDALYRTLTHSPTR